MTFVLHICIHDICIYLYVNRILLQSHDPACNKIWQLLCNISRAEFQKVYDALGVVVKEVGESFYNPFIPANIDKLREVNFNSFSFFICIFFNVYIYTFTYLYVFTFMYLSTQYFILPTCVECIHIFINPPMYTPRKL
jgi:hypothetical protein